MEFFAKTLQNPIDTVEPKQEKPSIEQTKLPEISDEKPTIEKKEVETKKNEEVPSSCKRIRIIQTCRYKILYFIKIIDSQNLKTLSSCFENLIISMLMVHISLKVFHQQVLFPF